MKPWRDPVHRARVLQQEREIAATLFHATEEEQRQMARSLGVEHHLPEPQQDLLQATAA